MSDERHPPRVFFLNESHELANAEKDGGGGMAKLAPIDWNQRGQRVFRSLVSARQAVAKSPDPTRERRYFLAALPEKVKKVSDTKKRGHQVVEQAPRYDAKEAMVFRRLGMDLLAVDSAGRALVHAPVGRIQSLEATAANLGLEGDREKARWATIGGFEPAPSSFRIDGSWLEKLPAKELVDVVVELQPSLSRTEVEEVARAVIAMAQSVVGRELRFQRTGTDFSGRHWFRGGLSKAALETIAANFFSVQSLHEPFFSVLQGPGTSRNAPRLSEVVVASTVALDARTLPCVAVVDTGVPDEHRLLAPYRRGRFQSPDVSSDFRLDHGSFVASRVVFGNLPQPPERIPSGACAFLDVRVARDARTVDDKAVLPALQGVVGNYPDVRVFNLSLGNATPLALLHEVPRRAQLQLAQDLDNFAFWSDAIVVVAAGNSELGVKPTAPYPEHADLPEWGLGAWACGFNTLTCGAFAGSLSEGVAKHPDWPSPITRTGPGLGRTPVPDFGANGGNCDEDYHHRTWLGVCGCDDLGEWQDRSGTSHAAPILAREAAFVFAALHRRCEQTALPFAALVRAILVASAERPSGLDRRIDALADRTIGRGRASARPVREPSPRSALLLWQGVLEGPDDRARVRVPVPREWLKEARQPKIRLVGAWNTPASAAAEGIWAARRVEAQLRPQEDGKALVCSDRSSHASYPVLDRTYDLSGEKLRAKGLSLEADHLILGVSYKEIAPYPVASFDFSPFQRVGFAMELFDADERPASPQAAMQALPAAETMVRLSTPEQRVLTPVLIRRPT